MEKWRRNGKANKDLSSREMYYTKRSREIDIHLFANSSLPIMILARVRYMKNVFFSAIRLCVLNFILFQINTVHTYNSKFHTLATPCQVQIAYNCNYTYI